MSWRLHAEPILWLAGLRALLLQMLLPRALAGVLQNSNFREDPWGRLLRTARFYGEVVYGPTARAERAGARVRRIHAAMSGTDPATGERFRVDEPDLLRWIHVTATESFCSTAMRAGLRLSPAEVDRYYDEQRAVAGLMGLDEGTVPATAADVDAYYDAMRPKLAATPEALATARYLAVPTFPWGLGYTPVRPLWIGVAAYGFSLLPPWARRLYGMPGLRPPISPPPWSPAPCGRPCVRCPHGSWKARSTGPPWPGPGTSGLTHRKPPRRPRPDLAEPCAAY